MLTNLHSYAFLYYHVGRSFLVTWTRHLTLAKQCSTRTLYFGRDPLGRRSLLVHYPDSVNPYFLLSSVSAGLDSRHSLEELSTEHLYAIDLSAAAELSDVGLLNAENWTYLTSEQILELRSCTSSVPRKREGTNSPFVSICHPLLTFVA